MAHENINRFPAGAAAPASSAAFYKYKNYDEIPTFNYSGQNRFRQYTEAGSRAPPPKVFTTSAGTKVQLVPHIPPTITPYGVCYGPGAYPDYVPPGPNAPIIPMADHPMTYEEIVSQPGYTPAKDYIYVPVRLVYVPDSNDPRGFRAEYVNGPPNACLSVKVNEDGLFNIPVPAHIANYSVATFGFPKICHSRDLLVEEAMKTPANLPEQPQGENVGEDRCRSRNKKFCVFCKSNRESWEYYSGHTLKDMNGVVTCPVLRKLTCPLCGANGNDAHTSKYCPQFLAKVQEMNPQEYKEFMQMPQNTRKLVRDSRGVIKSRIRYI